jgi:hypothetical protein
MRQIFIDANIFTNLLTGHPVHGRACQKLVLLQSEVVGGADIAL